jgi:hypothetical protein
VASPISKDLREYALPNGEGKDQADFGTQPLMRWVRVFTTLTTGFAVVLLTTAFLLGHWHVALAGTTVALLAAAGGVVLCVNAILADRQEFWRRGQLDGWMRGWRGQEPEVDDPLFR